MIEYIYPIAAFITLAGLVYKTVELRRNPGNPALQAICGLLGFLALSVGIGCPLVLERIAPIVGSAGGILIAQAFAVLACVCAQALVLHLGSHDHRRTARRIGVRWFAACAVLLTMGIGLWVGRIEAHSDEDVASTVSSGVGLGVYLAYLAFAAIDILRLSTRYARTAARPLIRLGIRLLSTASLFDLIYVGHKATSFVMTAVGKERPGSGAPWDSLLMLGSVLALNVGVVLPSLGPLLAKAARWPTRWHLYRRLHPLWLAVYRALPQIALEPPDDPERDHPIGPGMYRALYRRVIEIHDALLHLGPYTGGVGQLAREQALLIGADPQTASATADAAIIAIGIRELEGAHPAVAADASTPTRLGAEYLDVAELDVAAERLVLVAEALHGSPVVHEMVTRYAYGRLSIENFDRPIPDTPGRAQTRHNDR